MNLTKKISIILALLTLPILGFSQQQTEPKIGLITNRISGKFSEFPLILKSRQIEYEDIAPKLASIDYSTYDLIIIEASSYPLDNLHGMAIQKYVKDGGIVLISNVMEDGFSKTWSPYVLYRSEYTDVAKIVDMNHPIFQGFKTTVLKEFAKASGWYVGHSSFSYLDKNWKVLATNENGNASLIEARYGKGHFIVSCQALYNYNKYPIVTIFSDNLLDYVISISYPTKYRRNE